MALPTIPPINTINPPENTPNRTSKIQLLQRRQLAERLRQLLLGMAEPAHQVAVADRLFHRVEIGALDVLDDRELEHLLIGEVAHDDRHLMQAGELRRGGGHRDVPRKLRRRIQLRGGGHNVQPARAGARRRGAEEVVRRALRTGEEQVQEE